MNDRGAISPRQQICLRVYKISTTKLKKSGDQLWKKRVTLIGQGWRSRWLSTGRLRRSVSSVQIRDEKKGDCSWWFWPYQYRVSPLGATIRNQPNFKTNYSADFVRFIGEIWHIQYLRLQKRIYVTTERKFLYYLLWFTQYPLLPAFNSQMTQIINQKKLHIGQFLDILLAVG